MEYITDTYTVNNAHHVKKKKYFVNTITVIDAVQLVELSLDVYMRSWTITDEVP